MPLASTADFSESFAHLTLDNTDKLSTSDDLSIHSLHDLQAFLELARQHDLNTESRQSAESRDPEFADISLHLTPLVKNGKPKRLAGRVFDTISEGEHNHKGHSDMDGAALFRALQPFIDLYMAQKSRQLLTPASGHAHDADSDLDLKVEDTFDKIRRHSGSTRAVSPMTTPPGSSGSHLADSKDTFVGENTYKAMPNILDASLAQMPLMNSKIQPLARRIPDWDIVPSSEADDTVQGAQTDDEAPLVELPDLTTHEIDLGDPHGPTHNEIIAELRMELEHYKQDNCELVNELQFVRSQLESLRTDNHDTNQTTTNNDRCTLKSLKDLKDRKEASLSVEGFRKGNIIKKGQGTNDLKQTSEGLHYAPKLHASTITDEYVVDEKSLPEEFRPYYLRLQLAKVDTMTSSAKSNLIKNIMLSLLVSDFDHLPSAVPQVGSYLRITSKFLDDIHKHIYPDNNNGPLRYLRDYALNTSDGLQECLDGMFNRIM